MAKPKTVKRRSVGSYKYTKCPSCHTEIVIDKPYDASLYYCGNCSKIIDNAGHSFCGWCGAKIDWD